MADWDFWSHQWANVLPLPNKDRQSVIPLFRPWGSQMNRFYLLVVGAVLVPAMGNAGETFVTECAKGPLVRKINELGGGVSHRSHS